jgi:proteic killer suppression protein
LGDKLGAKVGVENWVEFEVVSRLQGKTGGKCPKGFPPDVVKTAVRKLTMIEYATVLSDLRSPPRNCLEALKRDRKGQHSIRINDKWRVCFVWKDGIAENVEITDYH